MSACAQNPAAWHLMMVQNATPPPAATMDSDVAGFTNNVAVNGGTIGTATIGYLNTLVTGLKDDGVWSKLTEVYPFCGDQLAAALTKLKYVTGTYSTTAYLVNHGFTAGYYSETGASGGLYGDGTMYTDTRFNPAVQPSGAGCSATDFSLAVYWKGTETPGTSRPLVGNYESTRITLIGWMASGTADYGAIYSGAYAPNSGSSMGQGFASVTCNGSESQIWYVNGSASGMPVTSNGNDGFYSVSFHTHGANGLPAHSTRYVRWISIGTGLSATDQSNLYNRVRTFQTSLSRNLQ